MKVKQSAISGFSILELMIVIIIMVTLAAIAHTVYLNFVTSSKVIDAINVLDEYKNSAMGLHAKDGYIDPYYVLFPEGDETGWVSGSAGGTSAVKNIDQKYANTVSADIGTSSGNLYILLGVGFVNDGVFVSGSDHIYIAGIQSSNGAITWKCGISASKANSIAIDYLPKSCQDSLP